MNRNFSILIVDDDHYLTMTLADILATVGYKVQAVNNAAEALRILRIGFDCVLSDIIMPEMNDVDLQVAALKRNSKIPFLFTSAYAEKEIYEKAHQQGAIAFLEKPIQMDVLFSILERLELEKDILISVPNRLY